jgi:hypothetical protein
VGAERYREVGVCAAEGGDFGDGKGGVSRVCGYAWRCLMELDGMVGLRGFPSTYPL